MLIVDDEVYIRLLLKSIMGRDYNILEACDGQEAVDMARAQKPDLILMDIMMPRLDGVGACSIIKSDPLIQETPVVMLTARTHKLDQDYAVSMGADGYIAKPFRSANLLDKVAQLLANTG